MPEEKIHHRVRIDMTKVDHFVEFINRPYFYQDVSYGTKFLKLDSGETIEMRNVVRTVTKSTMISRYIQFCQEEKFEPLSRTTLFKILDVVRQASQSKSLQGLDNTAADGSTGFQKIEMIVDDLGKGGMNRQCCAEVKERLKNGKRYLKTNYRVHCNTAEALCPDRCRKFALNDEQEDTQKTVTSVKICEMSWMKSKTKFDVHFGSLTAMNIETICSTTSNWHRQIFLSGRLTLFAM